jgi:hypothetical protein
MDAITLQKGLVAVALVAATWALPPCASADVPDWAASTGIEMTEEAPRWVGTAGTAGDRANRQSFRHELDTRLVQRQASVLG